MFTVTQSSVSKQHYWMALMPFPPKWRICGRGLNQPVHEWMMDISNVNVLLKTRSGNVNACIKGLHCTCHLFCPEQTPEESEKTKQFCLEVVDLLKHSQQYRMMFNKFVPSYHHHFGHQCRVSDYGFSKLQDLFEAIPHVVEVSLFYFAYYPLLPVMTCNAHALIRANIWNEYSVLFGPKSIQNGQTL